jgi:plasmid stabilization system protein ParE
MKLLWSAQSVTDLDTIYTYIANDSPIYAQRIIDRIIERGEQLVKFPRSGRHVPEFNRPDIREIFEGRYRIIYRIKPDALEIVTVLHGAMQMPEYIKDVVQA